MFLDWLLPVVVMLASLTGVQVCEDGLQQAFFALAFVLSGINLLRQLEKAQTPILYRMACVLTIVLVAFCTATLIEFRIA